MRLFSGSLFLLQRGLNCMTSNMLAEEGSGVINSVTSNMKGQGDLKHMASDILG